MSMPQNVLSSTVMPGMFLGGRAMEITDTVDYELGGIALNDPSEGSMYQIWRARIIGSTIVLDASTVAPTVAYTATGVLTEVSFSFDQNMRPTIAFVEDGRANLYWYDSFLEMAVTTTLAVDVVNPRVSLDDKRYLETGTSDVILGYLRGTSLYFRQQRDRFQTEYLLSTVPADYGLHIVGMNNVGRLQFMLRSNG